MRIEVEFEKRVIIARSSRTSAYRENSMLVDSGP